MKQMEKTVKTEWIFQGDERLKVKVFQHFHSTDNKERFKATLFPFNTFIKDEIN